MLRLRLKLRPSSLQMLKLPRLLRPPRMLLLLRLRLRELLLQRLPLMLNLRLIMKLIKKRLKHWLLNKLLRNRKQLMPLLLNRLNKHLLSIR